MSANASLLELRTRARRLSDTENDVNISDSELDALANTHISELWDRLVDAGPADYYASSTTFATTVGLQTYALPANFRNLTSLYVVESDGRNRPLVPMPEGALGSYKAPSAVSNLLLEYIPTPATLEADGDTIDGISGWTDLIANLMARDVMTKRESDPSIILANIARLEARITQRSRKRDRGPKRTVDLDEVSTTNDTYPWGWNGGSRLAVYRLRADNLEIYEPFWDYP